jgi:hypothetical protein
MQGQYLTHVHFDVCFAVKVQQHGWHLGTTFVDLVSLRKRMFV